MENTIDLFVYAPDAAREAIGPVGMATLDHLAKGNSDAPRWVTGGFLVRCLMANWLRSRNASEQADALTDTLSTVDVDLFVDGDDEFEGEGWSLYPPEDDYVRDYCRSMWFHGRKIDLIDSPVVKAGLHDFPLNVTRFDFDANIVAYSLATGHLFSARPVARFGTGLEVLRPTTFSRIDKYMAMGFRQVAGLWGTGRVLDEDEDRAVRLGQRLPYKNVDLVSGSDGCVCVGQTDPKVVAMTNQAEGLALPPPVRTAAFGPDDIF